MNYSTRNIVGTYIIGYMAIYLNYYLLLYYVLSVLTIDIKSDQVYFN